MYYNNSLAYLDQLTDQHFTDIIQEIDNFLWNIPSDIELLIDEDSINHNEIDGEQHLECSYLDIDNKITVLNIIMDKDYNPEYELSSFDGLIFEGSDYHSLLTRIHETLSHK